MKLGIGGKRDVVCAADEAAREATGAHIYLVQREPHGIENGIAKDGRQHEQCGQDRGDADHGGGAVPMCRTNPDPSLSRTSMGPDEASMLPVRPATVVPVAA